MLIDTTAVIPWLEWLRLQYPTNLKLTSVATLPECVQLTLLNEFHMQTTQPNLADLTSVSELVYIHLDLVICRYRGRMMIFQNTNWCVSEADI